MRLRLPTLLQRFDGIDAQFDRSAQRFGFFNHGLAQRDALGLHGFQRRGGFGERGFPLRLQFGKGFFAQMTGFAPTVAELVQNAIETFPIAVQRGAICFRPRIHLGNQRQTLRFVFSGFGTHFVEPAFNDFVGFVARFVKTLPERVIRNAALVGLFPLFAQRTQSFLHFATANRLAFGTFQQTFGLCHEVFAQLVGAPTLPAFEFTRRCQRGMGLGF